MQSPIKRLKVGIDQLCWRDGTNSRLDLLPIDTEQIAGHSEPEQHEIGQHRRTELARHRGGIHRPVVAGLWGADHQEPIRTQ